MSIQIIDLCHTYSKGTSFEKKAIEDINISIDDGAFVGLIGHTGSGKSTLIQHLNVLLRPSHGKIIIDGEDIFENKSRLKAIRSKVGLVFQYPEHQLFEMTVVNDVAFGPKNIGWSADAARAKAEVALETVGIADELFEKSPFELSGGQKRRVAIAGVLAMQPSILVLDEPTAGLDPKGRDDILDTIKKMHKSLGMTVILVSHSMEDIARLVDKIFVINHGRIVLQGSPKEVFAQVEELESIGLATTQAAYVAKKLKEKGFELPDGIYTNTAIVAEILKVIKG